MTIATVLRTSGSLLPPVTRQAIDAAIMRYVNATVTPAAPAVVAAARTAALGAILASLCAAHRTQSPLLPHALCVFRAGVADSDPGVAVLCCQGLALSEALLHPRAPPLHELESKAVQQTGQGSQEYYGAGYQTQLGGGGGLFATAPGPAAMEVEEEAAAAVSSPKEAAAGPAASPAPGSSFLPELQGTVGSGVGNPRLGFSGSAKLPVPGLSAADNKPAAGRDDMAPPPPATRSSPRLAASAVSAAAAPAAPAEEGDSDSDDFGDLVDADPDE